MILVKKADGRKEEFDPRKIVNTSMRAGLSRRAAENIARKIVARLYDGISTHEIYQMALKEIESVEDKSSMLFRLREAVSEMPSDKFELYIKKVLESYGYKCQWNVLVKGMYVEHQIDLIAEKSGKKYLVECKHHINPHRFCGLGIVLQVQARLEDIKEVKGTYQAWVVTNTKFSEHAKAYARGKNLMLSGWRYKGKMSLESMVQGKRLYPVCIINADKTVIKRLLDQNIITVQDALSSDMKAVDNKTVEYIKNQSRMLLA
ncbi:MAG: restriction endonuclease [Candidatus Aenigmarchaeota archaeon]|nr:restriction endonuclease [Candidatus Aenigmarchaeota archaeon]